MLSGLEASISDGNLQNNGQSFFVILINNSQALTLRSSFSQLPEVHYIEHTSFIDQTY